jgi:hypothetical protein
MPLIPISSATELVPCLELLRRQQLQKGAAAKLPLTTVSSLNILAHCVEGSPLSEMQTAYLGDSFADLRELVYATYSLTEQRKILDLVGDSDGIRLVRFFNARSSASR